MPLGCEEEKDVQMSKERVAPDRDIIKVIVFASIIIILSIVLIGSIVYIITKNEAVHKLKKHDLVNIAESMADKVDSRIERAQEVSLMLAADPQIKEWVAGGERDKSRKEYTLKKINTMVSKTDYFDYSNSFIVSAVTNHYWDEKGHIIDTMTKNDPDDNWFYKTISSEERVSISIDYNRERKDTFVFINALMGDIKDPLGVTGVGMGLKNLSVEFQEFKYGKTSDLWLIDKKGNIYLSDNVENNGQNIDKFLPGNVKQKIINYIDGKNREHRTLEYKNSDQELLDLIVYPLDSTQQHFLLFKIPRSESISFLNTIKLNTLLASIIVLISITFFFYFVSNKLVNPYKKAIKYNRELEDKIFERTQELQEKNTKLTDSIEYAQRIQKSMLPPEEVLSEVFNDYFLIWQPRDTVGGDFYWVKQFDSGYFFAVGDCTGHGVPGALMSVISISILNQVVNEKDRPSEILKKLNILIKQTLKQEGKRSLTDDGLDIALCFFDGEHTLIFAGAKASLYIKDEQEIKVLRGNKKSVGYTRTSTDYSFSDINIDVRDNNLFYITTDGFIDQSGDQNNYSFGKKRFEELINNCYMESLSRQRELFLQELVDHMGDEPQRDDITVLGFTLKHP
ncbi:MAG: SpoIIE family protein phosphatase [Clostridiales bacterium]|nr:SpoIIE family protein phosphatase [Clostridiales bacterium]MCF8023041.1 SpoIIE family protein phosphatase [Clostridiales bacterium]